MSDYAFFICIEQIFLMITVIIMKSIIVLFIH